MSKAFLVRADDIRWAKTHRADIDAAHIRGLPGVQCPICIASSVTGVLYPSADVILLDREVQLLSPWPVPLEELQRIMSRVQPLLGPERPLWPGTALGPLRGKAWGEFGDFAWVNPWTPLLRESAWLAAKEAGVDLLGVPAELTFRRRPHESLIELEARPKVRLPSAMLPEQCPQCGRLPIKKPDKIVLEASAFDDSIALQRVMELPTALIANERFAQFIEDRKLTDVVLTPVELT